MNEKEILQFLAKNKSDYFKSFGVTKLGLFGSAARGENPSDIDLIVEFQQGTEDLFEKKNKIREDVELRFNLPVDICREKFIKPGAKKLIMQDAIFV